MRACINISLNATCNHYVIWLLWVPSQNKHFPNWRIATEYQNWKQEGHTRSPIGRGGRARLEGSITRHALLLFGDVTWCGGGAWLDSGSRDLRRAIQVLLGWNQGGEGGYTRVLGGRTGDGVTGRCGVHPKQTDDYEIYSTRFAYNLTVMPCRYRISSLCT